MIGQDRSAAKPWRMSRDPFCVACFIAVTPLVAFILAMTYWMCWHVVTEAF